MVDEDLPGTGLESAVSENNLCENNKANTDY